MNHNEMFCGVFAASSHSVESAAEALRRMRNETERLRNLRAKLVKAPPMWVGMLPMGSFRWLRKGETLRPTDRITGIAGLTRGVGYPVHAPVNMDEFKTASGYSSYLFNGFIRLTQYDQGD